MPVKVNNFGKFCVLLLLAERPVHGYELIKRVGERTGGRASPGQIYPFLKLLEKNGFVASRKSGSREKTTYSLTGSGRNFAESVLDRMEGMLDAALKSRIVPCSHCNCEIYRGSVRRKGKTFCCEACAGSSKA